MEYKELQAKAKSLGLKYVGVSADKLEKSIKNVETKTPKKETPKEKVKQTEEENVDNKDADAVVYHGKHKVRTYTLERHGKDYIKLAKQYVSHPKREEENYRVEFEKVETRIMCPNCGKKFRL